MSLQESCMEIRRGLLEGVFSSKAAVRQGIVLRLLDKLGWLTFDMRTIIPEYSIAGRKVDYALCHPLGKPIAIIEVKRAGQKISEAGKHLIEFAFQEEIRLVILTDGAEWCFFLPQEHVINDDSLIHNLDITMCNSEECTYILRRYLSYANIADGSAIQAVRDDHRDASRKRVVKNQLPQAWLMLVNEQAELLFGLIAEKVERLCGFKPDAESVSDFLTTLVLTEQSKLTSNLEKTKSEQRLVTVDGKNPHSGQRTRSPKGEVTNQKEFERPILQAIVDLGGRGNVDEIMANVERKIAKDLTALDRELQPSRTTVRWKNAAQWARFVMVEDGRLLSDSPRGIWEISNKGRQWLAMRY